MSGITVLRIATMLAAATLTHAATIFSTTQHLTGMSRLNPGETWEVSVTSTLSDNFNGDFSKEEWRYTLTNISYVPDPIPPGVGTLTGNGITLFNVPEDGTNPAGGGPFQDYFEPPGWSAMLRGFVFEFTPVNPVLWRTGSSPLLPGESGDFGFSITGPIAISMTNVYMSSELISGGSPGPVDVISGTIPVPVPVPEPGTLTMLAAALSGVFLLRGIRRVKADQKFQNSSGLPSGIHQHTGTQRRTSEYSLN
jgi:hypothetical protein